MAVDPGIYGIDLYLENGDLNITNNGDIQTISSLDNVGQAVKNALITERGTLFYDQTYGINLLGIIGNKNIDIVKTRLQYEVLRMLKKDYRVEKIEQLTVEQDENNPSQINIYARIKPINSMNSIDISVYYPYSGLQIPINNITSEKQLSINQLTIAVNYSIYSITGVWLSTDINKTGINYFTGGFINYNNVSLGTPLPYEKTNVIVDYSTLNVEKSKQVYQIFSEQIFCNDLLTMQTKYNINDIAGIWITSDTYKETNLINSVKFSNKTIQFDTPITRISSYYIDYSTLDDITKG